MDRVKNDPAIKRFGSIAQVLVIVVLLFSVTTLIGWSFGRQKIPSPFFQILLVSPFTSSMFAALSITIILWRQFSISRSLFAIILFFLLMCNFLVLSSKIFNFPTDIDTFFFHQQIAYYQRHNDVSAVTAICFVLTIISLWMMQSKRYSQSIRELLNVIVFFVCLSTVVFYLFRVPEIHSFFLISPLTAFLFVLFSLAALMHKPDHGFIQELILGHFGSSKLSIILPFSIIFPIALGYFRLLGEWNHLISSELGVTFIILMVVIVFGVTSWLIALSWNKQMNMSEKNDQLAKELSVINEELQSTMEEFLTTNEELTSNIEALSKANKALEKANAIIAKQKDEQLNRVLDSTNDVVWSFDLTGKSENYLSRSAEKVYNQPYEVLLTKPYFWKENVIPEDQEIKKASQIRLHQTGETSCSYRVLIDGKVHWFRDTLKLIKDNNGTPVRLEGVATDITEMREKEIEVMRERNLLRSLIDNIPSYVFLRDTNLKTILSNRATYKLLGATREDQVLGHDLLDYYGETARELYEEEKNILKTGVPLVNKEIEVTVQDQEILLSATKIPLKDEAGKVIQILGISHDITELRKKENELKLYRQNLEIIFKNSADNFVLIDKEKKIILLNDSFGRFSNEMSGVTPQVGMSIYDVLPQDRIEPTRDILKKVLQGQQIEIVAKSMFKSEPRYFSVRFNPVTYDGEIKFVSISAFDVTEKKNQEIKLEKYQQELEAVFNNSSDIFFLIDSKHKLVVFNRRFSDFISKYVGRMPEEDMDYYQFVPQSQIEINRTNILRAFKGESFEMVNTLQVKDESITFQANYRPIFTNGEVTHVVVSAMDVTEIIKQQQVIQEYRENLDIIFQNSTDFFLLLNAKAEVILLNRPFENFIRKYSKVEPRSGILLYDIVAPNRKDITRALVQRALKGERIQTVSEWVYEGEIRYYDLIYTPVMNEGEVNHITITATDITDKVKQESLAKQYQDTIEIIFKTSRDTFLLISAGGEVVSFNQAFEHWLNDVANISPKTGMNFLDVIVPDQRHYTADIFNKVRAGERSATEAEFTKANGEKIFFYLRYEPIIKEGIVTHVCVTGFDVTEFRKIENELKRDQYFLEKASESAKIGYWTSEPIEEDGKLTWSKEVFKIFGIKEKDFRGINSDFFERLHPEDRARVKELTRQAIERGSIYEVDHRIILPDGTARWVNERAQVLRDKKNEPTLMVGVIQDINDRKITESVLREYNERFEVLSKATNDAIWDLDIEKDIETWNHGLETIFGYQHREITKASHWWVEKIHPEDYQRVKTKLTNAFETFAINWISEYRYLCANGSYKNVLDRAYIIYNSSKKPVRIIGAIQDITEVVQYRQNLENMVIERTEKLNKALLKEKELIDLKGKFISIASHEFRTPLATIGLSSNFLKRFSKKIKPEQIEEKASMIERQVQHMTYLVDDVLFVGKSEEGKVKVQMKLTPLTILERLAREALASRGDSHVLKLNNHALINEFYTDEKLLRNIVFNLVSNAVKFSPKARCIYFTIHKENERLSISVRDEGIGIPSDELKNLFSSFNRASNAQHIEGTGLGLLIIKRAVELLKGSVNVRSELGKGTEFTVALPLPIGKNAI